MQTYERARLLANPIPVPREVVEIAKSTKAVMCNHALKDVPVRPEFTGRLTELTDYSRVAALIQLPGGGFAVAVVNILGLRKDNSGQYLELLDKPRGWKKIGYGGSKKLPVAAIRALICAGLETDTGVTLGRNGTAVKKFLALCGI